jgi:hypothetical protein
VILNATKISVDMIERLSSDIMVKGMPKGMCFGAEQTMKYVVLFGGRGATSKIHTDQAIERGQDRLNLYKGLRSGYNDDAGDPAVMHACLKHGQGPDPDKKAERLGISSRELETDLFVCCSSLLLIHKSYISPG